MATNVVAEPPLPPPPPPSSADISLDLFRQIDLRAFTQEELHGISQFCNAAGNAYRDDDLVVPQIDLSVFNESAGSRRQTYSRLRLRHPHHRTTRLPGLLPNPKPQTPPATDPEDLSILHSLKHFLAHGSDFPPPPPPAPPLPLPQQPEVPSDTPQAIEPGLGFDGTNSIAEHGLDKKRKRERKGKVNWSLTENGVGIELQIVNKKGEQVDLKALESNGDSLYSEELKKRTTGLEKEEQILGFLTSLEGQWGSRRKRRKYVDASEFADALPIGWKVLLGLKRREGRASVNCRRFISPTGQAFMSCKEASTFLQTQFVLTDAKWPMDQSGFGIQQINDLSSGSNAGVSHLAADIECGTVPCSSLSTSVLHGSEVSLLEIDNLAEVKIQDLFECYKCKLSFAEKNAYLQHLFSSHEQTTKRVKFGQPVGEGVIIRDGKYECQFCHKVFEERRKYNSHVGVHVKNHKGPEELGGPVTGNKRIETLTEEGLALTTATIDASVEIPGISTATPAERTTGSYSKSLVPLIDQPMNLSSDPCEMLFEDSKFEEALVQNVQYEDNEANRGTVDKNAMQESLIKTDVKLSIHDACPSVGDMDKYGNSDKKVDYAAIDAKANNKSVAETSVPSIEACNEVAPSSRPFMPSLCDLPAFDTASNKVDNEDLVDTQKLESVTGFEDLKLDDIEPIKYSLSEGQELSSLPGASFNLASDAGTEQELDSSIRYNSEEVVMNMGGAYHLTTFCVWCRSEFKLEAIELERQSDTIGYMCPTCKDKISGHFNSGLP